jgi:hypothetical protein
MFVNEQIGNVDIGNPEDLESLVDSNQFFSALIASEEITRNEAVRIANLSLRHRLNYKGGSHFEDSNGMYNFSSVDVIEEDDGSGKGWLARSSDLGTVKFYNRGEITVDSEDIPEEIVDFLAEGLADRGGHWSQRCLALYSIGVRDSVYSNSHFTNQDYATRAEVAERHISDAITKGSKGTYSSPHMLNLCEVLGKIIPSAVETRDDMYDILTRMKERAGFTVNQVNQYFNGVTDEQREILVDVLARSDVPLYEETSTERLRKIHDEMFSEQEHSAH